jgi:hypothetical protein
MALPVNITTKTVTGKFIDLATQNASAGSVTFTPSLATSVWLLDPTAATTIVPSPATTQLDGTGAFSVVLPCTNDPDVSPINFTWHVKLVCGSLVTEFDFSLPTSSPATVDLSTVAIVPTLPVPLNNFVKTVNGVAPDVVGNVTLFTIAPTILDNMSDVNATTPADKDIISWDLATTTWVKSTRLTSAETNITTLQGSRSAKFSQNTAQSMTASTNVKVQFPNTIRADTGIVTAGGTSQDLFTVVPTGTFNITAAIRLVNAAALPELMIYQPGSTAFAVGNVKAVNSPGGRSATVTARLDLAAGATFAINCFNNGTVSNTDTTFGSATHVTVKYEGV